METLPPEIITKILEYLPFGDRRVVAMVNKAFYYASYHPAFSRKEFLTYQTSGVDLKKFTDFKKMLKKSRRKLFCLKFVDFIFIDDLTIFTNLGNHIISLHFNNLKCLNDSFLDAISQCCRNLEKLELVRLQDLSITDKNRAPIYKLCSITLDDVQMSDREFNPILKFAPNLKDLSIVNCNINGSSQVLKRFYPQRTDSATSNEYLFNKYNSNYIFSDINIIYHLNNSVQLNSLRLNQCCHVFYQIQSIQQLKSLVLDLKNTYTNQSSEIENFKILSQCILLEQLEIDHLPLWLLPTVSKLCNLRHLTVKYSIRSGDDLELLKSFVDSLKDMKYIRKLSFNIVAEDFDIVHPIFGFPDCIFTSLTSLDCSLDANLRRIVFSENLISLRIRNAHNLSVSFLQKILTNVPNVKHLHIDRCSIIDDSNFVDLPISNLKELITLKILGSRISHLSLRHIWNSTLKVITFDSVSLLPFRVEENLLAVRQTILLLGIRIPLLTQLEIYIDSPSFSVIEDQNLLSYYWEDIKELVKRCFKEMKIFRLWK